jgi:hypothetical protein
MAVLISDYIVFFVFLGVLVLFAGFMVVRQCWAKHSSVGSGGLRLGLKRMFSRRKRSHSFSFKSEDKSSSNNNNNGTSSAAAASTAVESAQNSSIAKSSVINKV